MNHLLQQIEVATIKDVCFAYKEKKIYIICEKDKGTACKIQDSTKLKSCNTNHV